jgi:hypothetical protein
LLSIFTLPSFSFHTFPPFSSFFIFSSKCFWLIDWGGGRGQYSPYTFLSIRICQCSECRCLLTELGRLLSKSIFR